MAQEQSAAFEGGALPAVEDLSELQKNVLRSELFDREVLKVFSPPLSISSPPTPFGLIPLNPTRVQLDDDSLNANSSDELLELYQQLISQQNKLHRWFEEDSRTDMYLGGLSLPDGTTLNVTNIKRNADAVFALIRQEKIQVFGSNAYFFADTYGESHNVCADQEFLSQPSAVDCPSFLITDRLLATAGHCVQLPGGDGSMVSDNAYITSFKAVRNFHLVSDSVNTPTVSSRDIFSIKGIRARVNTPDEDWAILELQRPVDNPTILSLSETSIVDLDTKVHTYGFPLGLPMKFAFGGMVTRSDTDKPWFFATVDAFSGNSGSPVINDVTGKVEGILVNVLGDWAYKCPGGGNDCSDSERCRIPLGCSTANGDCDTNGEQVTRIAPLVAWLNDNS